ncbi:MAG TPA: efflux RND transporter periplasmic adaptor subunit [Candidatus Limenecus avicola]|jgi:efflux transporter, RND family, MFP subunit|uniref:Efflux RND transporter periplasmic adaptor subunit n=1 Tax=Candidatus Limenecus avicola TaxID=2840847 RepID=A0A9D1MYH7_9CLOT|nr:efflux RND transporter periplasmic adaptor subunit [Clostridium sp.]HIU91888.1 efflux RND transporter periplasmic adaptor subunit [Candidatus Limenecus avicola]
MKKRAIVAILILLIIAAAVCLLTKKKPNPDELTLYGNIEIRQVDLSFQVPGQISLMLKEEGDSVKKGELVALLDDRDYKSNLEKAAADVLKTSALSKDASSKYARQAPLCADSTVSKQECDTLLNTKNKTKADYDAAVAQKTFAKNQLDYTKIYAPDDGTITVRVQEPGATVNKGQVVYTIAKTKPVWIRAYVNESDLGNIKYGMKARVLTDSKDPKTGQNREYEGRIGYISPVAEFTPKTVESTDLRTDLVYRIRVYVDEIDDFLRQGMPTTIKINLVK